MATYCVVDQVEIPEDRERRHAVTCSVECKKKLAAIRKSVKNQAKKCPMCYRPCTPEERILFQRWRRETFPIPKKGRPKKKPENAPAILGVSTQEAAR